MTGRFLSSSQLSWRRPLDIDIDSDIDLSKLILKDGKADASKPPRSPQVSRSDRSSNFARRPAPLRKRKSFERHFQVTKSDNYYEIHIEAPELCKSPIFRLRTWKNSEDNRLFLLVKDRIDPLRFDKTFELLPDTTYSDLSVEVRWDRIIIFIVSPAEKAREAADRLPTALKSEPLNGCAQSLDRIQTQPLSPGMPISASIARVRPTKRQTSLVATSSDTLYRSA